MLCVLDNFSTKVDRKIFKLRGVARPVLLVLASNFSILFTIREPSFQKLSVLLATVKKIMSESRLNLVTVRNP